MLVVVAAIAYALFYHDRSTDPSAPLSFHGEEYEKQSAAAKKRQLAEAILASRVPGKFFTPQEVGKELLSESMNTTFETPGDEMPKQGDGFRKKVLHTVGALGFGKWVPVANNLGYTGIFADGSETMLLRLSSGYDPIIDDKPDNYHIAAGITLKFLRDGRPSVNILAVHSLPGQTSYNFFAHDFSNHVADFPSTASPMQMKSRANFARGSPWPVMLGLSGVAGSDYIKSPRSPYRVIFHPTTALHKAYPDTYPGIPLYQQLSETVKPGLLYKVYAIPTGDDALNLKAAVHIANIVLTTELTTSTFGDSSLFFRHIRFDDDLKHHPEFEAPAQKVLEAQQAATSQFVYPDLPFE